MDNHKPRVRGIFSPYPVARLRTIIFAFFIVIPIIGQIAAPKVSNQATANSSANEAPKSIPFSEIVAQTESELTTLKQIDASIVSDPGPEIVERDLPALIDKIDLLSDETARTIEGRDSLERLRSIEAEWKPVTKKLSDWDTILTGLAKKIDTDIALLADLSDKWNKRLDALKDAHMPPELNDRIQTVVSEISRLRGEMEARRSRVAGLQIKVGEQAGRTDESIRSIQQARETLVGQLLQQDSSPLWSSNFWSGGQTASASVALRSQVSSLETFANNNAGRLIFHFFSFLTFAAALMFLRRFAKPRIQKDPSLKNAAIIFSLPVSTAAVLAILINGWIYTQTPQILQAIFGAVALIPTVIIVRKLVERPIYLLLYSLVAFYLIDQFRILVEGVPLIARLVFFTEMVIGLLFFLWLFAGRLAANKTEENIHGSVFRTIRIAAIIATPLFAVSAIANFIGYAALARLVGNAALQSAYAAIVLYAVIRIVDGLIIFALRFRPFCLLGMVQNHRFLIQHRLRRFTRWVAVGIWVLLVLDQLAVRTIVFSTLGEIRRSQLTIGSLAISLSDILAFVVAVWASFLLSRFVRFTLDEDVFPRFSISRGLPYAISTVVHYAFIVFGFFLALAIVGIDLTKLTIIAGAFGVGIGFGLQNIVNNFVSGIILLFERPVSVGDTVQVGDDSGDLTHVGLRASVIRTFEGSEVIVPNGDLISEKVVNWTLSDQRRRLEIEVGVTYDTDPHEVLEILKNVGKGNPHVLAEPEPDALFLGFGDSSLNFQLRAWIDKFDEWVRIKSDLYLAIHDALSEAEIEIPFPQVDANLRR